MAGQEGNRMSKTPTVLLLLLRALRLGLLFCAICVALFFAIEVWKNWFSGAHHDMFVADYAFLTALVAVFAGALALWRSIAREIRKMETIDLDRRR